MKSIFNSHGILWRIFLTIITLTLFTSCTTEDFYCHVIEEEEIEVKRTYSNSNSNKVTLLPTDTLIIYKYDIFHNILEVEVPKYDRKISFKEDKLVSFNGTPMSEVMANWETHDAFELVFGPQIIAWKKFESYLQTKLGIEFNWKWMLGLAILIAILTELGKKEIDPKIYPYGRKYLALGLMIPVALYSGILLYHMGNIFFSTPDDWSFWQKFWYYIMEGAEAIIVARAFTFINNSLESVSTTAKGWDLGIIALVIWMICAGWFDKLYATQFYYIFYVLLGMALIADIVYHIKHPLSIIFAMVATIFTFFNILIIAFVQVILFIYDTLKRAAQNAGA